MNISFVRIDWCVLVKTAEYMQLTYPYYGIRAMVDHTLKLKETHLAQDDDTLRNININKLTINMLKSELLYRGLSTTHSKKEQLVQRLSSFLSSKNE